MVCTTEDPIDNLEHHQKIAKSNLSVKVSTAFRPDKAILIQMTGYNYYIDSLGNAADISINSYQDLCDALRSRIEYFNENGCKLCDHGLNQIYFENFTESEVKSIFEKKRNNQSNSVMKKHLKFQSAFYYF